MTDNSYKLFASPPSPGADMRRLSESNPKSPTDTINSPSKETLEKKIAPNSENKDPPTEPLKADDKAEEKTETKKDEKKEEKKPEVIKGPFRLLRLLPRETRHIIGRMLEIDPRKRAKMEEIHADDWVSKTVICEQDDTGVVHSAPGHTHTLEPPASAAPPPEKK